MAGVGLRAAVKVMGRKRTRVTAHVIATMAVSSQVEWRKVDQRVTLATASLLTRTRTMKMTTSSPWMKWIVMGKSLNALLSMPQYLNLS